MVNSVLKVLEILNIFSPAEPRLSLSQISQRMGIPKSTAHNLLNTLLSKGFIERVGKDDYALGTSLIRLTQAVRVNVELRDRAAPLLRELADISRESVYLTVPEGDNVLYIYAIESPSRLLARTAVGDLVPMHCTGTGKAVLSCLSSVEISAFAKRTGLTAFTPSTITDSGVLLQEMEASRARGYALDRQEHEEGTFCIGAPIFDSTGHIAGACSISGTDPEIVGNRIAELADSTKYTALEISRRMGYVPSFVSLIASLPRQAEKST